LKKKRALKKLLQRIRGVKISDYVKYRFKEEKTFHYGTVIDIDTLQDGQALLIKRRGKTGISALEIITIPGDEVHLVERRKKDKVEGKDSEKTLGEDKRT